MGQIPAGFNMDFYTVGYFCFAYSKLSSQKYFTFSGAVKITTSTEDGYFCSELFFQAPANNRDMRGQDVHECVEMGLCNKLTLAPSAVHLCECTVHSVPPLFRYPWKKQTWIICKGCSCERCPGRVRTQRLLRWQPSKTPDAVWAARLMQLEQPPSPDLLYGELS